MKPFSGGEQHVRVLIGILSHTDDDDDILSLTHHNILFIDNGLGHADNREHCVW